MLDEDQFGYRSMHFVLSYKEDRLRLREFSDFRGKKAEVQIRTILQHAWAAIDWKLRYKPETGVLPRAAQRRLFRISALLETAEDDFSQVTNVLLDLRKAYKIDMQKGDLEIEVNQDSLEELFTTSKVVEYLQNLASNTKSLNG